MEQINKKGLQTGSRAHPHSYLKSSGSTFLGSEAASEKSWQIATSNAEFKN
jgi:hypothetical protein